MAKVSVVKTRAGIKQSLYDAIGLIGGFTPYIGHNDRVLLKPNLNGVEGFTNIELTEALLQLLLDYGIAKVCMAESTYGNEKMTNLFFNKTGYAALAHKYNIELINLNSAQAVAVKVAHPLVLETLMIAGEALEADAIINLPNMKVHYATGITLAMKNMKGILARDEKRHFHEVGLDKAIADLNNTIKPRLTIVDAITCMERMGPRGGDLVNLGLIMAGGDAAEVDFTGARIMGYTLSEVKHLEYYVKMNNINVNRIEIAGERIAEVCYPFKKVNLAKILPHAFRVHNCNACSACENAFLLSCQLLGEQPPGIIDVYMGELTAQPGAAEEHTQAGSLCGEPVEDLHGGKAGSLHREIAFGNCCPGSRNYDKVIKGCPPYPFALGEYLQTPGRT